MAAAYFIVHAPQESWLILNGGELAITLCWPSLYFAAHGPGAWAVDSLRSRVRAEQAWAAWGFPAFRRPGPRGPRLQPGPEGRDESRANASSRPPWVTATVTP
jgi:hypothetical protein